MPINADQLFAHAERAFRSRQFAASRSTLQKLRRTVGEHPAVLHLLALTEREDGHSDQAAAAFLAALRVVPGDPQINNNYALLLEEAGKFEAALRHFTVALRQSGFVEARLNRAILHERMEKFEAAEIDALAVIAAVPTSPAGHIVLGSILRARGRLDAAAHAFDAALTLAPDRPRAVHGRARVALERGETIAVPLYRRALVVAPEDGTVLLGLASALEAEGDPAGADMLSRALSTRPDWIDGHRELIRMRSEAGDRSTALRDLDNALARKPSEPALHLLRWNVLLQSGEPERALGAIREAKAKGMLPATPELALAEATCADEAGDQAAGGLLTSLDHGRSDVCIAYGRHLLRTSKPDQAASVLHRAVQRFPDEIAAWAHLELAWRSLSDARHQWLAGAPGLVASLSLGLSTSELDMLAQTLRQLHLSRAHPIGQSLRGGTQTRGALLERVDPILRHLRAALDDAVAAYLRGLPPADPTHPLLRRRSGTPTITGSWSIRLAASGFHVSHIHPLGSLSSACHIVLPATDPNADRAGWLELGTPPSELNLRLPPLVSVEPRPGQLTLFPSYLFHGTRPFDGGERLTVAFDVTLS